jgi:hypothetical protein
MTPSNAKLNKNLTRERFYKGDLVAWWKNADTGRVKEIGIVLDSYPSNVYESASCDILISEKVVNVAVKYLFDQEH